MAKSNVACKKNVHFKTKVKTGCSTCRIRKIKCDESKPSCQKCVNTGRTCDGYKPTFRLCTSQVFDETHNRGNKSKLDFRPIPTTSAQITPYEIDHLNQLLSTKTFFNVKLDCDEVARQLLQASLTDAPIRHAVSSLRALRKDFEKSGNGLTLSAHHTPNYNYGLQQYSLALGGLASSLSSVTFRGLQSALLCCHIFVSIEQVQGNYAAMTQHIIRGLGIMREYRARPDFTAASSMIPGHHDQLPMLDIYILKLFIAPCKYTEFPAIADQSAEALSTCSSPPCQRSDEPRSLRTIAPDMRAELKKIAVSALKFLDKTSQVEPVGSLVSLLAEKKILLDSLKSWLIDYDLVQVETKGSNPEPISRSFVLLFYLTLKIVLLGVLESSSDLDTMLQIENDRLQSIADSLTEKLRDYRM